MTEPRPINAEEFARWSKYLDYWAGRTRPEVIKAVSISELKSDAHIFLNNLGVNIVLYDSEQHGEVQKLMDLYNRVDRSNMAVEGGRYGLSVKSSDIDIIAPTGMKPEEYNQDIVTGFGLSPIIWVAVVGVLIIGGIWMVSKFLEAKAKKTTADASRDLIAADKEIAKQPKDVRDAWSVFKKQNEEKIEKVGLLDQLLGTGFGSTLATFIGLGLLVYIGSKAIQGRK